MSAIDQRTTHGRSADERPTDERTVDESTRVDGAVEPTVADALGPGLTSLVGVPAVEIEFWDGSTFGDPDGPGRLRVKSLDALRRIIWSPDQLGFARAFVAGDIDITGPVPEILRALQVNEKRSPRAVAEAVPAIVAATQTTRWHRAAPPCPARGTRAPRPPPFDPA